LRNGNYHFEPNYSTKDVKIEIDNYHTKDIRIKVDNYNTLDVRIEIENYSTKDIRMEINNYNTQYIRMLYVSSYQQGIGKWKASYILSIMGWVKGGGGGVKKQNAAVENADKKSGRCVAYCICQEIDWFINIC